MPNLTTKMDLTSTTIQIRNDDAKSNFLTFEHRWESTAAIRVVAKINKSEDFDKHFSELPYPDREYVNLVCNQLTFDSPVVFYLPDWVFLTGDDESMGASISNVLVEVFTGLYYDPNVLFKVDVLEADLDPGAEIVFPVE